MSKRGLQERTITGLEKRMDRLGEVIEKPGGRRLSFKIGYRVDNEGRRRETGIVVSEMYEVGNWGGEIIIRDGVDPTLSDLRELQGHMREKTFKTKDNWWRFKS